MSSKLSEASRKAVGAGSVRADVAAALGSIARTRVRFTITDNIVGLSLQRLEEDPSPATTASWVELSSVTLHRTVRLAGYSAAADLTGILASVAIAGLGLIILPVQKRRVTERFRQSTERLREQLTGAMREAFERELAQSLERIRAALAPYERFARVEHDRAERLERTFAELGQRLAGLRQRAERL